jgi:flagellar basal body-associated protein FliL
MDMGVVAIVVTIAIIVVVIALVVAVIIAFRSVSSKQGKNRSKAR